MTTEDGPDGQRELSTFALDVYWASGRPPDAAIERHLAACARCRAYLAMLDARSAALKPPDGLEAAAARAPVIGLASRRRRWLGPASAIVALAACLLLVVKSRLPQGFGGVPQGTETYVGTKGTPAVQLLVHRGGDTRIWDGHSAVRPGDSLVLRVACEGLAFVTVAAPLASGWGRLSESPCPAEADVLPFTLQVDNEPGTEQFAVVLSTKALDPEALRAAIDKTVRSESAWVVRYALPKETGAGGLGVAPKETEP
jgi:hypothetical protein